MKEIHDAMVSNIKSFFRMNGFTKAVIGMSGGIDSSVCAALVSKAIGTKNLHGLILPEKGITSKLSIANAEKMCKIIGMKYSIHPINNFLKHFKHLWKENPLAAINTKARIRMCILYNYANTHSALVIGTSNKSELMLGYGTKWGDMAGDLEILGELWKTDVIKLGAYLKIPPEILDRQPTAELAEGQTDAQELGATYDILDKILQLYEDEYTVDEITRMTGFDRNLVKKTVNRVNVNSHKTTMIPVIKTE